MTVLKYYNGTAWVELPVQGPKGDTGATGADGAGLPEVYVGPDAPTPRGNYLLWVDNDALSVNPFVDGPGNLLSGFWAEDPSWVERPTVSGSKVSTWRNAGGGAAVQATSANQPTWVSPITAMNSRAGVQFGTSLWLSQDVVDKAVPYWVAVICRMDDTVRTNSRNVLGTGAGAGAGVGTRSSTGNWAVNTGAVLDSGLAADTAPHLVVGQMQTSGQVSVDGVIKASGTAGGTALSWLTLGIDNTAGTVGSNIWPGSIHFVGIYSVDPRTDPRWTSILALATACGVVFP